MGALDYHKARLQQMEDILIKYEDALERVYLGTKDFPADLREDMARTIINQEMLVELEKLGPEEIFSEEDLKEADKGDLDAQFSFLDGRFAALNLLQVALFSEDGMIMFRRDSKDFCLQSPELKAVVKKLASRFDKIT